MSNWLAANGSESRSPQVNLEELRRQYCPLQIKVLFVGESPPARGTFFYKGDSGLARYTKMAFQQAYDLPDLAMADFLHGFKTAGCYLDDLCHEPVNRMTMPDRRAAWKRGVDHLTHRLETDSPLIIVPILRSIENSVRQAAERAGFLDRVRSAIRYPGMGFHPCYIAELSRLLVELRDASVLPLSFL
jgi:hypothetical protein